MCVYWKCVKMDTSHVWLYRPCNVPEWVQSIATSHQLPTECSKVHVHTCQAAAKSTFYMYMYVCKCRTHPDIMTGVELHYSTSLHFPVQRVCHNCILSSSLSVFWSLLGRMSVCLSVYLSAFVLLVVSVCVSVTNNIAGPTYVICSYSHSSLLMTSNCIS